MSAGVREIAPCGTVGGYHRHLRGAGKPCEQCRRAASAYERERRRENRRLVPEAAAPAVPALGGSSHLLPCRAAPDAWFPEHNDRAGIAKAKAGCARCPVLGQCRAWVDANPQRFGVWAGLSESDRRRAEREQEAA